MSLKDFKATLDAEVSAILSSAFTINVSGTNSVPHSSDPAITFPNLDSGSQSCKLLDTCVLYVDIRRSTELSLAHHPKTVAKLYSSFVRAMTRAAVQTGGHVRGIIGDRVMVIFEAADAFNQAIDCAILMHSISDYVINKHFKANEVKCGIGIDAGRMLVTKTGIRKNGIQRDNYKNLVWLGRPANVASKLTDLANKAAETTELVYMDVAYQPTSLLGALYIGQPNQSWTWQEEYPHVFVQNLLPNTLGSGISHNNPNYRHHIVNKRVTTTKEATPAILMTRAVWDGFRTKYPTSERVTKGWFKEVKVVVPGFHDKVFGGSAIKLDFQG